MLKERFLPKKILLVALFSALLISSCSSASSDGTSGAMEPAEINQPTAQDSSSDVVGSESAGSFISYETYQADQDVYSDTKVVLFFNARWCSTCRKAVGNIESDLNNIPSNLTIVTVDFDDSRDLRQEYGVTLQHTFVQIDSNGSELAKWSGSLTADQIFNNTV